jgi:hypothetical protein
LHENCIRLSKIEIYIDKAGVVPFMKHGDDLKS